MKLIEKISNTDSIRDGSIVSFVNPYSYTLLRKDLVAMDGVDLFLADGSAFVIFHNAMHENKISRASFDMTSLAPSVFEEASAANKVVYFVGSNQSEIDAAIQEIKRSYPKLNVPRYRNGYFDGDERENELERLAEEAPDIVIVGMGTPLQEQFLIDLRKRGWQGTGFTCGGFLHQTAKGIQYYPRWMDKFNLRWLYRIYDEPKLIRRYTIDYSKFVFLFLYDVVRAKLAKK